MAEPTSALPPFPRHEDGDGIVSALARGMTGVSLRGAVDADLPYLRQLYAGTREAEMAQVPWPPAVKRAFLDQQFALQHAHYVAHFSGAQFFVLQRGEEPIGRYYLWRDEKDVLIVDISLDRHVQGQGIGGALIRRTQMMVASQGRGVRLSVRVDNVAARRLYERLGFQPGPTDPHGVHVPMRWVAPASSSS